MQLIISFLRFGLSMTTILLVSGVALPDLAASLPAGRPSYVDQGKPAIEMDSPGQQLGTKQRQIGTTANVNAV
jgi:hypothetical protein